MATRDRNIPKPSVSFLSEVVRSNSNDVLHRNRDSDYRQLNRRLLRIQIFLVVLGLTLLVASSVALIEERKLFGLGFGVCGAFAAILSARDFIEEGCISVKNVRKLISVSFQFLQQQLLRTPLLSLQFQLPCCMLSFISVCGFVQFPYPHIPGQLHANNKSLYWNCVGHAGIVKDTKVFVVTSCDAKILAGVNGLSLAINTLTIYFIAESFYKYLRIHMDEDSLTNYTMIFILCFVEFAHSVPIMAALTYNLLLIRQLHLFKSKYETT